MLPPRSPAWLGTLGLIAGAGCGLIDLPEAPETDIVTDNTRLPESDASFVSAEVAPDRVIFTYAVPPTEVELEAGQVIVGQQDGGYLREVKSVEVSGNTLIVLTGDAAVTDAISNARFSSTIEPGASPDGMAARPGPGSLTIPLVDLTGRVLVDTEISGVPVKITVARGIVTLEPSIDLDLEIAKRKVERLAVTAKGTLTLNLDVKIEVGGFVQFAQELDLSGPTAALYTHPFVFLLPTPIGPFPVTGTLELDAFAGVSAKVSAGGVLTGGLEGSSTFALRAVWEGGAWTVENEPSFDGMIHRPTVDALLATEVRAYVRPEARVRFYGVAGPRASVTPSLKAGITALPTPTATLEGCITGEIGFDAKLFGTSLVDLAHQFPETCKPLLAP